MTAERLAAALAAPLHLAGRDVTIRASIGVTLSVGDAPDPATLLAEADGAMFWAKRRGRRLALFDERMRVGAEDVLTPGEPAAAGLAWLRSGSTIPGVTVSAGAGRLLARMATCWRRSSTRSVSTSATSPPADIASGVPVPAGPVDHRVSVGSPRRGYHR